MAQRLFIVDVESTSATPYSGVMTEFGIVDFTTRDWFHGHLWNFHPHPEIPALPIADDENPGYTRSGRTRLDVSDATVVFAKLIEWMHELSAASNDRAVFVSDNPAFDYMWMADGFDRAKFKNPFGHSARRIGDLAAGLDGKWRNTSAWKKHRRTGHDHNPVNDALGNAEALETILRKHNQI